MLLGESLESDCSETPCAQDDDAAINLLEKNLPETIDADTFINDIIGFTTLVQADSSSDNAIKARLSSGGSAAPRP